MFRKRATQAIRLVFLSTLQGGGGGVQINAHNTSPRGLSGRVLDSSTRGRMF